MKRILISFFALFIAVSLSAQKKNKTLENGLKEGDRLFNQFEFAEAADRYQSLVFKFPDNIEANLKAARSYVLAGDHANAEAAYAAAAKLPNAPSDIHFYYAQELAANGKYAEADAEYTTFVTGNPNDARANEFTNYLAKISALQADSQPVALKNLNINSAESDIAPVFCKKYFVFGSARNRNNAIVDLDASTQAPFYSLYYSKVDEKGNIGKAKKWKLAKLNGSAATFSADGNEVYFTASNRAKGKAKWSQTKDVDLKIYHAVFDTSEKKWTNIYPLPFCSSDYSVAHPSLSADGKRLFFVSDMPGGYGETDVYVSYRDGATWGAPINLGKNINTLGSELFPFIASDNTLYFASDNRAGLGGLDIYSATYSDSWNNVKNIGLPFNSRYDDFSWTVDETGKGFMASNRAGGKGSDDIYGFEQAKKEPKKLEIQTMQIANLKERVKKIHLLSDSAKLLKTLELAKIENAPVKINGDTVHISVVDSAPKPTATTVPTIKAAKQEAVASAPKAAIDTPKTVVNVPQKDSLAAVAERKALEISETQIPVTAPVLPRDFHLSVSVRFTNDKQVANGAVVTLVNKTSGTQWTNVVKDGIAPVFTVIANQTYQLCVSRSSDSPNGSYATHCETFSTNGITEDLTKTIDLTYLEVGAVIRENVYFDYDKSDIKTDEEQWLNRIVENMQQFKNLKIEITSHTDCKGDEAYNLHLSQQRLQVILNWLSAHKADMSRITASAYGETKPVVNCECAKCTDEENKANRCVEVRVLKM